MLLPTLSLGLAMQAGSPQQLLDGLRGALARNDAAFIRGCFRDPKDASYLLSTAPGAGGLSKIHVAIVPAPPGWEDMGQDWVVFHTVRGVEGGGDPVYRLQQGSTSIGALIPEDDCGPGRIRHADIHVRILATDHRAQVGVELRNEAKAGRALTFRLNDNLDPLNAKINGRRTRIVVETDSRVTMPEAGDLVRAGSLLIPWSKAACRRLQVDYRGLVDQTREDHINDKAAYLTGWWVPSLARLPFTYRTTILAPKGWVVRSESDQPMKNLGGNPAKWTGETTIPFTFPKVVSGRYKVAAELRDNGYVFRDWQFDPIDKDRAGKVCARMAEAVRFYNKMLVPFPYKGYECFDADAYYGIESYCYTLLAPNITLRNVAHEMGHTYFGGLSPSEYVNDAWNEGVTTYVDDVLTGRNVDNPLVAAEKTISVHVPLSRMAFGPGNDSAMYWRGAAAMKMLEHEIGLEKVLAGLRGLIRGQVGKNTTWDSLLPYFERASGQDLHWFWSQWIDGADFPSLKVEDVSHSGALCKVKVAQSGTQRVFRLRFRLFVKGANGEEAAREVSMGKLEETFELPASFAPKSAAIDVVGYALARATNWPPNP